MIVEEQPKPKKQVRTRPGFVTFPLPPDLIEFDNGSIITPKPPDEIEREQAEHVREVRRNKGL